jgi:hypothetical protein
MLFFVSITVLLFKIIWPYSTNYIPPEFIRILTNICVILKLNWIRYFRMTNRQIDKQIDRQTNSQTNRQTDKQTTNIFYLIHHMYILYREGSDVKWILLWLLWKFGERVRTTKIRMSKVKKNIENLKSIRMSKVFFWLF